MTVKLANCILFSLNFNHHKGLHRSNENKASVYANRRGDSNQRASRHSSDKMFVYWIYSGYKNKWNVLICFNILSHICIMYTICMGTPYNCVYAWARSVLRCLWTFSHYPQTTKYVYTKNASTLYIYVISMSSNLLAMPHMENHSQQLDGGFKRDRIYLFFISFFVRYLAHLFSINTCRSVCKTGFSICWDKSGWT